MGYVVGSAIIQGWNLRSGSGRRLTADPTMIAGPGSEPRTSRDTASWSDPRSPSFGGEPTDFHGRFTTARFLTACLFSTIATTRPASTPLTSGSEPQETTTGIGIGRVEGVSDVAMSLRGQVRRTATPNCPTLRWPKSERVTRPVLSASRHWPTSTESVRLTSAISFGGNADPERWEEP